MIDPIPEGTTPARRRMLQAALEMIRAGQRPSADALVVHCGGSKSTAIPAMQELYSEVLPRLLAGSAREAAETPPDPVMQALLAAYAVADREAKQSAKAEVAAEFARLTSEREADAAVRDAHARQREIELSELAALRDRAEATDAANARLSAELSANARAAAEAAQALATARADVARLTQVERGLIEDLSATQAELQHAETALAQEREARRKEVDAVRAQLKEEANRRVDEIKTIYFESEQRLRVELDAVRTAAAGERTAHAKAIRALEDRLEQQRIAHSQTVSGLRESVAEGHAQARRDQEAAVAAALAAAGESHAAEIARLQSLHEQSLGMLREANAHLMATVERVPSGESKRGE